MDVSRRRAGVKSSVVAGSVWESRMKHDEVKGGIKVFNGEEENPPQQEGPDSEKKMVKKSPSGSAKRKTWKPEGSVSGGSIQIARGRSEGNSGKSEGQLRDLSVSADGIKRSPIQGKKGRSEGGKELSLSVDGIVKNPNQVKKGRSESNKEIVVSGDGNEKNPVPIRKPRSDVKEISDSCEQLRKEKSDPIKVVNQSGMGFSTDGGVEKNSDQSRTAKSETDKVLVEPVKENDEPVDEIEMNPPEIEVNGSEETCKEFGVCQEKVISSNETIEETVKSLNNDNDTDDICDGDEEEFEEEEDEEEEEEEIDEEIVIEKKTLEIKEINISEEKPKRVEINVPEEKPKKVEIRIPEQRPKKVVNEVKKVQQFRNTTAPSSSNLNKQPPPVLRRATFYQNFSKTTTTAQTPVTNEYKSFPETHNKLQNLVDLVMWRDISRSAFVFGIGTFIIISSSYTKDLNVSFISVISYLGLVYLASIFLYRSLIFRGVTYIDDDRSYVLGEDEAIWLLKLILPYLNEFLLKIRALFSGDPSTTMKMAVLLFVFARCGNSITIWKMAKLGFFGVFIVPKVCSSYSTQFTGYAKFWIRRFRDAWDSCSHKKAVALAIFSLVWNLSSMVARVWAVFMMFVAVRFYQQTMERDDWVGDDVAEEDTWQEDIGEQSQGVEKNKVKKGY